VIALVFVLVAAPVVLAVPSISLTVTPNPNNSPQVIKGDGAWSLDKGQSFSKIVFGVTLKSNGQETTGDASAAVATWEKNLSVVAGDYIPTRATLQYIENKMVQELTTKDDKNVFTVK